MASEMVNMIVGQRAYEANSKTIQTCDQMLQLVNNLKR
jgi:flagellar basal-body rod protein FlgG